MKKVRLRKLVVMAMVLMMVFSLAACKKSGNGTDASGGNEAANTPTASAQPSQAAEPTEGADLPDSSTSTILSTGPNGEVAVDASTLSLTEDQKNQIKQGGYTAAICMHYGGNDWATAQIAGLKATFEELGIKVVAVTDANFKAEQQVSDIETVMAKKPDIIVSIPVDATATADAYKKAAEAGIKLVFMDNVPDGMIAGTDYISCVSADNYGNGAAAADLLGEALNGKGNVGLVYFDASFHATNQRDQGFTEELANKYPDIKIVTKQGFTDENGCDQQGDAILTQYPDIDGIYASWDIPMEGVLSAVQAAGNTHVKLVCCDLGNNLAKDIAEGKVVGVGAQMPFDQGIAEATLAGMSMLGLSAPSYVAVPAQKVDKSNVEQAYNDVYHIPAPEWLTKALGK